MRVVLASDLNWWLRITQLATNQFTVEVPMISHLQMRTSPDAGFYVSTEGEAALADRFPIETSFGSLGQRQALVGLDPEAPKAERLFISLSGDSPGLRFWRAHRVDLEPLLEATGRPWAAGLIGQRMAVLWTGPKGLCFSRSAGAFGELPWATEILSPEAPAVDRASLVEAKDQILISLVHLETNADRSGTARLTAWRRPATGAAEAWRKQAVAEDEIPPADEPGHQFMVTRTGWQGNQLQLTFDLQRSYYGPGSIAFPSAWTDGIQAIYVANASDVTAGWTLVPSENLYEDLSGEPLPIKGGFRLGGWSGGYWRHHPFDQWFEFQGRPARFHREYPVPRTGPWPHGPLVPQLDWLPDQIQWAASDAPVLTGVFTGYGQMYVGGYGVPPVADPDVRYRVLRSPSLVRPQWQEVDRIGADEFGSLYHAVPKNPSAKSMFYRLEEVR